jgi:hypothetical protein
MANLKQYAYFLKGNKIALVENDITPENDPTSRDYGPDARVIRYKSPTETVSDGLEIEYTYSPEFYFDTYLYYDVASTTTNAGATNDDVFMASNVANPDWDKNNALGFYLTYYIRGVDVSAQFAVGNYVYITGNTHFNGMHQVGSVSNAGGNTTIIFQTPIKELYHHNADGTGNLTTDNNNFDNDINKGRLYYKGIKKMEDESFDLDLSPYLAKAVVYYLKGKMAEDKKDFKSKEYFMKQFKQLVEKKQSANIWGPRVIVPGKGSIR